MIDLRTHLISLIAVFIALGLGMVIGVDLIGGKAIVSQEKALVKRLEADFAQLRSQNAALNQTIRAKDALLSVEENYGVQTVPAIVSNRLAGLDVVIVTTDASLDVSPYVTVAREAGATVGPIITVAAPAKAQVAAAAPALGVANSAAAVYGQVATDVALALRSGDLSHLSEDEALGLVHVNGAAGPPRPAVLLIAGSATAPDPLVQPFGVPLARDLLADHMNVTEGELSSVPLADSTIPAFDKLGIATVDDIDLAPGEVAMVWGLSGVTGTFGEKPTAQSLMPPLTTGP